MSALISADELNRRLASDTPPVLLDVRYQLLQPDGHDDYLAGHVPGAVYVPLEEELARHGAPEDGRHPLPTADVLQRAVQRWGVRSGDLVVVYDGGTTLASGRAWWLLRAVGLDVRVLDGGYPAWVAFGGDIATDDVRPTPGDAVIGALPAGISLDAAAEWPAHGTLVDVRAAARFRGEVEPMDPIAGHIPGAVNLPAPAFFRPDGTFRGPDELATVWDNVAAQTEIAVYCGSGLTAAQAALAAEIAGRHAEVFVGSWSAWSNTPGVPIAVGE